MLQINDAERMKFWGEDLYEKAQNAVINRIVSNNEESYETKKRGSEEGKVRIGTILKPSEDIYSLMLASNFN